MAIPSVYSYIDYRVFLRDWMDSRKRVDSSYTYAQFATDGGCSKAAIANVLSGARNPRPDTIDAFARAMELSPSERNYLGLLVQIATAPDVDTRWELLGQLATNHRYGRVRQAEDEGDSNAFGYLQYWYIPAIRELATLPGFRAEPEWIASVMRPPVRVDQAREALDTLFELGVFSQRPDGTLEVRELRWQTEPEAEQQAATHYQQRVIPDLLRELVPSRDSDKQHMLAATLTIAPRHMAEFKIRLNNVVHQLATAADDKVEGEPYRVYQLAIQLFPLTEPIE